MLPNHAGQVTQDFIFNSASTFHFARAKDFLKSITLLDNHADDSEALKKVVSSAAQTAEEGLELVGEKSPFLIGFGGHPPTHPLGVTYHTAVPLRFALGAEPLKTVLILPYSGVYSSTAVRFALG